MLALLGRAPVRAAVPLGAVLSPPSRSSWRSPSRLSHSHCAHGPFSRPAPRVCARWGSPLVSADRSGPGRSGAGRWGGAGSRDVAVAGSWLGRSCGVGVACGSTLGRGFSGWVASAVPRGPSRALSRASGGAARAAEEAAEAAAAAEREWSESAGAAPSGAAPSAVSSPASMEAPVLLLVDVFSILHRAHHAFGAASRLSSPGGLDTSALRGLLTLLKGLVARHRPTHLALVSDAPGELKRRAAHPGYKAGRPPTPDGVVVGARAAEVICREGGIPWFGEEGLEADDLIAALVGLAREHAKRGETGGGGDHGGSGETGGGSGQGETRWAPCASGPAPRHGDVRVLIASSDRDFNQLLSSSVTLLRPSGASTRMREYALADFRADYPGIEPEQYAHLLALAGDRGDGIRGVDGVGPKGALELLREHKSVQGAIDGAKKRYDDWNRQLDAYEAAKNGNDRADGDPKGAKSGDRAGGKRVRPKRPKAPPRAVQAMARPDAAEAARLALSLARLDTTPPPEARLDALRVRRPADGGRAAAAHLERLGFGAPLELLAFIYDHTAAVDERYRGGAQ